MNKSLYPISKEAFFGSWRQIDAAAAEDETRKALCFMACDLLNESYFKGIRGEAAPEPFEVPAAATRGEADHIQALNAARNRAFMDGMEARRAN